MTSDEGLEPPHVIAEGIRQEFDPGGIVRFVVWGTFVCNDSLDLNHLVVQPLLEVTSIVDHIGDPPTHPGAEISASLADHHHTTTCHVLTSVVANSLDDGDGAGVPDREALSRTPIEVALTCDSAVQHGVADDDVLPWNGYSGWFGLDDDATA